MFQPTFQSEPPSGVTFSDRGLKHYSRHGVHIYERSFAERAALGLEADASDLTLDQAEEIAAALLWMASNHYNSDESVINEVWDRSWSKEIPSLEDLAIEDLTPAEADSFMETLEEGR